ncbi:MAG: protein kinase, partial [Acidobacteriota bacterium]
MSTLPTHIARYSVVEPIAAGGMGEVFLARDDRLDRLVAIKLLRDGFDSDELRSRFEEEARNVAKLTHPNIVTIYEYGAHEGRPYIAMEYVAGHSMADLVRRKMPLSLARRVRLIEELCAGLGHAHKAHLVHRDIKPANLMVSTSGMLKVLDFGIAKLRGTDRTQKGMLVGTVNYMSPEQITGQPVDHRSDIFAVGLVLHEVLTYDQAFKGDLTTAMFAIVHGQAEPLAARCPGLDPGFQAVVNRCLAKSPADRYQDLSVLKRDLGRLRRPLEDEDGEMADTLGPFADDKTLLVTAQAATAHTEAKEAGPDTRRARESAVAAGEVAIARGQFESAVRHAEQALALEGDNAAARDLLERARRAVDAAKAESQVGRARDALAGDRLEEARSALAAAAILAPEATAARDLGLQIERRAADLARFDEALRGARAFLDERDVPEASRLAGTAARIRPDDAEVQDLRQQIDRVAEEIRRAAEEAARQAEAARIALEQQRAEAERLAQRQREADAARIAQEQQRAEAEAAHVVHEKQRADAARLARQQREAEAARVAQEQERADAEAARVAHEQERAEAEVARLAQEQERAEAERVAVAAVDTTAQAKYWDTPTQVVAVRGLGHDGASGQVDVGDTAIHHPLDWPAASVPVAAPVRSRRRPVMAVGAAAILLIAMWMWPRQPVAVPSAEAPAADPSSPADTAAVSPAPPANLGSAPLSGPSALSEFKNGREAQPGLRDAGAPSAGVPALATATAERPGSSGTGVNPRTSPASPNGAIPPRPAVPTSNGSNGATAGTTSPAAAPQNNEGSRPTVAPGAAAAPPSTPGAASSSGRAGSSAASAPTAPRPVATPGGGVPAITTTPAERVIPNSGAPSSAPPAPAPPAPPSSDGAAAAQKLDETSIRGLVNAFGQAYQSKDLKALRAVWPAMTGGDESSYRNVFNSYRSITWTTN